MMIRDFVEKTQKNKEILTITLRGEKMEKKEDFVESLKKEKNLISVNEVAKILGVHKATAYQIIKSISHYRFGTKYMVEKQAVYDYIDSCRIDPNLKITNKVLAEKKLDTANLMKQVFN